MKLWSYGDSHAAGHELGSVDDLGASWIKKTYGYNDRDELRHKKGLDFYHTYVRQKWSSYIENKCSTLVYGTPCSPELSYAGEFSKLIGAELINCAVPGSSNDFSMLRLFRDLDKIDKNDIVMFSLVTPMRFLSGAGEEHVRTQIQWQPKKIQKVLYNYGPGDISFNLLAQGLIHTIKSLFPNAIILKTNNDDISVESVDTTTNLLFTENNFTEFVSNNSTEQFRYVLGHIDEKYHKLYAQHLYEIWKTK